MMMLQATHDAELDETDVQGVVAEALSIVDRVGHSESGLGVLDGVVSDSYMNKCRLATCRGCSVKLERTGSGELT